jgi:Outer membrane protein beta-barrel domain
MKRHCAPFAIIIASLATSLRADALGSVGVEAGVVQRRVFWIWPDSLRTGFGFGAHADLDLSPLFKLGPYYLHSTVGAHPETRIRTDEGEGWFAGGAFNTFGLRTRFLLPVPGSFKPYAQVGLGYTWVNYDRGPVRDMNAFFFEAPIGVGLAYELNQLISFSFDASYRHGFFFHGKDIDDGGRPSTGTSLLLGVALGI